MRVSGLVVSLFVAFACSFFGTTVPVQAQASAEADGSVTSTTSMMEESCADPELEGAKLNITVIDTVGPSPILIIDGFLDADLVRGIAQKHLVDENLWTPVIPNHRSNFSWDIFQGDRLYKPTVPFRGGGFPGLRSDLTEEYQGALRERLQSISVLLERYFPDSELQYTWSKDSFFGNVCYNADSLSAMQRVPHVDDGHVKNGPIFQQPIQLAIVHYLNSDWKGIGGTGFYRDIESGGSRFRPSDCTQYSNNAREEGLPRGSKAHYRRSGCFCTMPAKHNLCAKTLEEYASVYSGYQNGTSSEHYEMLYHAPYQFNRAVIYDSKQLHSAIIPDANTLSCRPTEGRLTANIFVA